MTTKQAADFFPGQIAALKYIRDETDFQLTPCVRMLKAASELGDVTVTYDPGNPEHVKFFTYPNKPIQHKITVRVQRANHQLRDSRCYWAEITHYE